MEYSAIIVAAGSGSRMKLGYNKVYAKIEHHQTILEKTISIFSNDPDCLQVIVVTDPETFQKQIGSRIGDRLIVVEGGSTRQESVSNGLKKAQTDIVMIHDGARPFLPKKNLEALKNAMCFYKAAILAVPCKDTIKVIKDGFVSKTIARDTLQAAQTPQAFQRELILTCMHKASLDGYTGTDDAEIVEKYSNAKIRIVEGSYENKKITTPEDLPRE